MKNFLAAMVVLAAMAVVGLAQDIPVIDTWDVELKAPVDHPINIIRGETKYLRPRYLVNGSAATITNVSSVQLWYKPSSLSTASWFYVTNGTFVGAGVVQIAWTPSCESTWSEYNYNIVTKSPSGDSLSAAGKLTLRGNVTGSATTAPPGRVVYVSDSATYITNGGARINGQPIANGTNVVVTASSVEWTNVLGVPAVWPGTATDDVARAMATDATGGVHQVRSWVAGFSNAPATYSEDFRTVEVAFPDGTIGQMFQELWVPIRNTSGVTITNGKAVRAVSANGFYSGAALASCTDSFDDVLGVIGLATETITNNGIGKITLVGNVNELDTTGFVEGSNLWLSATAGELTMTEPTGPGCKRVRIGACLRSNPNVGRIGVAVRIVPRPEDIAAVPTSDTNVWTVSAHSNWLVSGSATINGNLITNGASFTITGGGGNVASVFGRTGVVTAATGDYTAAQVGAVATNDARYLSSLTNPAAFTTPAQATGIVGSVMSTGNAYSASFVYTSTNTLSLLQQDGGAVANLRGGTAIVSRFTSGLVGTQVTVVDATPSWTGPTNGTRFYQHSSNPLYYTNSPRTWALQVGSDPVTLWALESVNGSGVPDGQQSFSSVARESDFSNFPCRLYASGGMAGGQATFVKNGTNDFKLAYWEDVLTAFDARGAGASAALDVETNLESQLTGYVATNDERYLSALTNAAAFATSAQGVAATNAESQIVAHAANTNNPHATTLQKVLDAGYSAPTKGIVVAGVITSEVIDGNQNGVSGMQALLSASGCNNNGASGYAVLLQATDCDYNGVSGRGAMQYSTLCNNNGAIGAFAMDHAYGCNYNGAIGHRAMFYPTNANYSGALGSYAGRTATGDGRVYIAAYTNDPAYAAGACTNDGYFQDSDGTIYLGFGSGAPASYANKGGVLRGTWTGGGFLSNTQTSVTLNTVRPPNGFEAQDNQTVAFNPLTRTATVTPTGASFRVTAGGVTYTYSGTVTSSAGPAVSGTMYAYFRPSDGAFVCTNVAWTITAGEAQAIAALYDHTTTSTVYTIDERHGVNISDSDHLMRHLTVGSTWASGMTISHFGADTAAAAAANGSNTCIAITDAGVFYDEDVRHTTVSRGTSGGSTNTSGVFPVLYRDTNSVWHKQAGTAFPFAWSGDTPAYWDASGVATPVAEDQYFVYWLIAVGSADATNLLLVSHPATYASTALAQSGATIGNLASLLGGFPNSELMVAYRLIFQYNAGAPNANPVGVKYSKLRVVDDYRAVPGGVILSGVGASSGSYELTETKIQDAGGVTTSTVSYYVAPVSIQQTITNTSALTWTNSWLPTQKVGRVTFSSTGTVTVLLTNWPSGQDAAMRFALDATGMPSVVWPSGLIWLTNGVYGSTAPALGKSNYVSIIRDDGISYQGIVFTNSLGTWGTP